VAVIHADHLIEMLISEVQPNALALDGEVLAGAGESCHAGNRREQVRFA
jgi:hypothetical protein